jgi:hypothetical protein
MPFYLFVLQQHTPAIRVVASRYNDPYVTGLNPTVGRGDRSFMRDLINRGPVSQQVWHVNEPSLLKVMRTKHRSKFAAPSPVKVTVAQLGS